MKSKNIRQTTDSNIFAGQISPNRQDWNGGKLAYFYIQVNADAIISGKDRYGKAFSNMAVAKGRVPYPLSVISACDVTFNILHDGTLVPTL